MARTAALAARWEAGGTVSMGPAGRDRRVRSVPKSKAEPTKKTVRSKRRQPGAREESSAGSETVRPTKPCRMEAHFRKKIAEEEQPKLGFAQTFGKTHAPNAAKAIGSLKTDQLHVGSDVASADSPKPWWRMIKICSAREFHCVQQLDVFGFFAL